MFVQFLFNEHSHKGPHKTLQPAQTTRVARDLSANPPGSARAVPAIPPRSPREVACRFVLTRPRILCEIRFFDPAQGKRPPAMLSPPSCVYHPNVRATNFLTVNSYSTTSAAHKSSVFLRLCPNCFHTIRTLSSTAIAETLRTAPNGPTCFFLKCFR